MGKVNKAFLVLILFLGPAMSYGTAHKPKKLERRDARLEHRQDRQEERIQNGWLDKELSKAERKTLNQTQARVKKLESKIRADGKVTKKEAKKMEKVQDKASQQIYKQKHDAQKKYKNPESRSNRRIARQDKRIEGGIEKGMLTQKEQEKLEKQQKHIATYREKAMEDGKLNKKEAKKIERKQDRASRKIYALKHNKRKPASTQTSTEVASVQDMPGQQSYLAVQYSVPTSGGVQ